MSKKINNKEKNEKLINGNKPDEQKKFKPNKINKKLLIVLLVIIVTVVILGVLFKNLILPSINYDTAGKKLSSGDYKTAVKIYESLGDFKDSSEKLDEAYFNYAKVLISEDNYELALEYLEKTTNGSKEDYISYAQALKYVANGEYSTGISMLEKMSDFENANEKLLDAYYKYGEKLLEEENYSSAKTYFEKAGDYEDASSKIYACDLLSAESKYNEGLLSEAKEIYATLPSDFEYNDVKVSDRLATLEEYSKFVKFSGSWKGTDGYYEVKHISKSYGSWDSWYSSYTSTTDIYCIINYDGTVTIKGTLYFYSYTNYSSLSSGVNDKLFSVPIDVTVNKTDDIPKTLVSDYMAVVASDWTIGYANVTYSDNSIKLSFSLNDSNYSTYFTNKYKSTITYKKA